MPCANQGQKLYRVKCCIYFCVRCGPAAFAVSPFTLFSQSVCLSVFLSLTLWTSLYWFWSNILCSCRLVAHCMQDVLGVKSHSKVCFCQKQYVIPLWLDCIILLRSGRRFNDDAAKKGSQPSVVAQASL